MNPSNPITESSTLNPSIATTGDRLESKVNNHSVVKTSKSDSTIAPKLDFSCNVNRTNEVFPVQSPLLKQLKRNKNTMATTNGDMTLKSMLKQTHLSPTILESTALQSFSRRNSYASDMAVAARSSEDDLGYGEDHHTAACKRTQQTSCSPAPKRRRYQRRNSFYIPETSRSNGKQATGLVWQAINFLYSAEEPSVEKNGPVTAVE